MSMVDLYEIGIQFLIQRDIFSDVEALEKGMGTLQEAIDKVNASLTSTADLLGAARSAAGGMASSFEAAASAAERLAAAADSMGGTGGGGGGGRTPPVIPAPGGPEYNPGGFTMPGYRDPTLLALPGPDGSYPPAPGAPSTPPQGVNPWDLIIAGGAAYEAGKGLITSAYDNAASVQHQAFLIENQGASASSAGDAVNAAQALQQQYPGLSQANAMTIIRDSYMQTRNMPEAIAMAGQLAQSAYVLQGLGDSDAAGQLYGAMRAGELRGLLNQKNPDGSVNLSGFENFIDAFSQVAISTGGRVTPQDALSIMQNAGPEGIMMDQHAMLEALMLSTDLGASKTGVGINALATEFLGGKMSQGAAQRLHDAGLLPDYMFDKNGKILDKYKNGIGNVLLPDGAVKNEGEFQQDPFEWIQNTFLPSVNKLDPNDQTGLLQSIYGDMSRIPGARLAAETIFQQGYLARQLGFLDGVPSVGTAANNLKNDPQNVAGGFTSAFDAFMAQIGSDAMPVATAQLKDLTGALNGMTGFFHDHPYAGQVAFRGTEAAGAAGAGLLLAGVYKWITKSLGLGGKGGAGDASFADADAVAGEGAVPLGEVGGAGAAGGFGAAVWPAGLIAAVAMAAKAANDAEFGPGWENNYRVTGKGVTFTGGAPIPVTIVQPPGAPSLPVQVTNPHDIATGTTSALARHQGLMPTGPNGINASLSPHLPGTDAPGASLP